MALYICVFGRTQNNLTKSIRETINSAESRSDSTGLQRYHHNFLHYRKTEKTQIFSRANRILKEVLYLELTRYEKLDRNSHLTYCSIMGKSWGIPNRAIHINTHYRSGFCLASDILLWWSCYSKP